MERNQLKRRLRELVRVYFLRQLEGTEVIIRALPTAYAASFDELHRELDELLPVLLKKLC